MLSITFKKDSTGKLETQYEFEAIKQFRQNGYFRNQSDKCNGIVYIAMPFQYDIDGPKESHLRALDYFYKN